jgi:hypothetical protein
MSSNGEAVQVALIALAGVIIYLIQRMFLRDYQPEPEDGLTQQEKTW